jgi:hypothetical protein
MTIQQTSEFSATSEETIQKIAAATESSVQQQTAKAVRARSGILQHAFTG